MTRSGDVPTPRVFADTPILDVSPGRKGPTHAELDRFVAGLPVELTLDDRYRLVDLLGRGSMGTVYLARDLKKAGRRVAIKVLCTSQDYRWAITRFVSEAKFTMRVQHPNVIKMYDVCATPEGVIYMVMEYLEGRDLREITRHRLPSWPQARSWMIQICEGLDAIHRAGIVHGDLKPANCFCIEPRRAIKILDFGVATLEYGESEEVVGTPEYMAPEQLLGEPLDRRADVYSAGVLLCALSTGSTPFHELELEEVFERKLHRSVPAQVGVAGLPSGLGEIVALALARDREHRYASIIEFRAALERADVTG